MRISSISSIFFVLCAMLVLSAQFAEAMTATTLTGMIRINVEDVPSTYQKSIGVKNINNESVLVSFKPGDEIVGMVKMESDNVILEPGEERFVKLNVTVTEMKEYISSVSIIFSRANVAENETEDQFGVATKIIIAPASEQNATVLVEIGETTENTTGVKNNTSGVQNTSVIDPGQNNNDSSDKLGNTMLIVAAVCAVLIVGVIITIFRMRKGAKNE